MPVTAEFQEIMPKLSKGSYLWIPVNNTRKCLIPGDFSGFDKDYTIQYDGERVLTQCLCRFTGKIENGQALFVGEIMPQKLELFGTKGRSYGCFTMDYAISKLFAFPDYGIAARSITEREWRSYTDTNLLPEPSEAWANSHWISSFASNPQAQGYNFSLFYAQDKKLRQAKLYSNTKTSVSMESFAFPFRPMFYVPIYNPYLVSHAGDEHTGENVKKAFDLFFA